ncbi:5-oxoprolinase subunit PxpB [Dyella flagellata]|uniref:Allophanate hydrolase n=1 Tax=Dyella flagellata TaxID=1867833 RepID=A0ABQ5X6U5_9GAMM|nr:5-oxoprolinase subunit PxpB [Dyella flagellata]GLQ87329.1 allophanate hydrolase [Dyella flagellata]
MPQAWPTMRIEPLAEDAWLLRLGTSIDFEVNARVHAMAAALKSRLAEVEYVPAYASLLLRFDPMSWLEDDGRFSEQRLREAINAALDQASTAEAEPREITIPVCYGGEAGEDLLDVASYSQLSPEEVVARHTRVTYRVAMLGFAPGFPYLLGLDPALATPRRSSPRMSVPAGSVAIGGQQTGIYPQELPGGWQLIGRTPLRLFDPAAATPSLLQPGDAVRFQAIDEHAYQRLAST